MNEQISKWLNAIAAVCNTLDGGIQTSGVDSMERLVGSYRVLTNVAKEMQDIIGNSGKEDTPPK